MYTDGRELEQGGPDSFTGLMNLQIRPTNRQTEMEKMHSLSRRPTGGWRLT